MSTRYTEIGASAAMADRRAGADMDAPLDECAVIQWVGLDDGGREALALLVGDVPSYEGESGVKKAREEVLRGYREELAAQ